MGIERSREQRRQQLASTAWFVARCKKLVTSGGVVIDELGDPCSDSPERFAVRW